MIIGFKCEPEDTNRHNPNHTRGKYPRIEWPIHHEEHDRVYDSHRDHETLQRINVSRKSLLHRITLFLSSILLLNNQTRTSLSTPHKVYTDSIPPQD